MCVVSLEGEVLGLCSLFLFFFKQKTAYEWRISDWSSDVCSSDLDGHKMFPDRLITGYQAYLDGRFSSERVRYETLAEQGQRPEIMEIGRASCRERVCQYVEISVVAEDVKKKEFINERNTFSLYYLTVIQPTYIHTRIRRYE